MGSPLVKVNGGGGRITLTDDRVVLELKVLESGQATLNAPHMPPSQVCKILTGLVIDLVFATMNQTEIPKT